MVQQCHFYVSNPKNWEQGLKEIFVHLCSEQHHSQKPKGKQHNCPTLDVWKIKMWWNINQPLKRKEILIHGIWMSSEDIMVKETSQSQNHKYCRISPVWSIYSSQIYRDRKYKGGCQGLGRGGSRKLFNVYIVLVLQDKSFWRLVR